jgi:hypothetical protein
MTAPVVPTAMTLSPAVRKSIIVVAAVVVILVAIAIYRNSATVSVS